MSTTSQDGSTTTPSQESHSPPTSSPPAKRAKIDSASCLIYVVEKKISSAHLKHLKGVAARNGFKLASRLRLAI